MLARLFPKLDRLTRPTGHLGHESKIATSDNGSADAALPFPDLGLLGNEATIRKYVWGFVWIGIAARAVRYFLCFPLWEDECFVCYNLIDRSYAELLQPLDYHQVAPILFLWAQLTVVKLLGFSEWTLRLIPFACGIGSVFLFRRVASRMLTGLPLVFAVAVFAVSYPGIRYAAEAKPYGTDLFVGLAMLAMFLEWRHAPQKTKWLWAMVAAAPVAIGISYPAAFVCGGLSVAVAFCNMRDDSPGRTRWIAWTSFNVAMLGAFGLTYWLAAANQRSSELDFMQNYWGNAFPPLNSLTDFLGWFALAHTSDLLAYPVGGGRGASAFTFLCCVAAGAVLVRKRRWLLLSLAGLPLLLNLIASAMHRYPYGGHVKFAQYHAAMITIVAGIGLAVIVQAHAKWIPKRAKLGAQMACAILALIAICSMGRDIISPYKSTTDMRHRAFAQWFWFNTEFQGETVCLTSDLDVRFSRETYEDLSWSAMYLCNQHIYSPRHAAGEPPEWDRVANDWPLRCVLFRAPRFDFDEDAKAQWLREMQTSYTLTGVAEYPFPCFGKREREAINVDYVEVFTFVPHVSAPLATKE